MSLTRAFFLVALVVSTGCVRPSTAFKDVSGVEAERAPIPSEMASEAPAPAPGGVVAAPHPLGASAGEQILRAGGTAYDAAVATALVIGVVANQSSGLGGGGFAVHRDAGGAVSTLDFRETAPTFFAPDTFQVEGRSSRRGAWAVGVPGEAAGLAELHRIGGRLPWKDLVEPARALAADGFAVDSRLAKTLARFSDEVLADPGLAGDYAPQGVVLEEGQTCVRPALAATLGYLQTHGGDALYNGPLAVSLAGFLSEKGAPWTAAEFSAYRPVVREPIVGTYAGRTVYSMPPPSSGGLALVQMLGMLEQIPVAEDEAASARTLAGVMSHAFADRAAFGGDPDFASIPVAEMVQPELLARLAALIPTEGPVGLHDAGLAGERGDLKALVPDDGGTTHISILDGSGAAVALTTTVNLSFGAGIQDPTTGILLNDEMDDFTARPGVPNAFGLVQGEANKVEPSKRPLSSMTPTLVVDAGGRTILAVGGAGGPRIITGTVQTLLAVLGGATASDAVASPRIHHQWLPRAVFAEDAAFPTVRERLGEEGFEWKGLDYAGIVQAAVFDPATGQWSGGADPRGNGGVAVWQP
jgi:gamma-glutamyltranspeptidase / glutathione hydrolase